jgi:HAAS domain-containing protein
VNFREQPSMDKVLRGYFQNLDAALARLPRVRRQQLIAEIREHVDDAVAEQRPDSESELRDLLARVGAPEDIAAAALEEDPPEPKGRMHDGLVVAMVIVLLIGGLTAGLILAFIVPTPSTHLSKSKPTKEHPNPPATEPTMTSTTVVSPPPTTTPPTTTPTSGTAPATAPIVPNGIYDSDVGGTVPHYFMSLTNGPAGNLSGSVNFAYQDGQTSVVFTFAGTVEGTEATLTPTTVPQGGGSASQDPSSIPSTISLGLGVGVSRGYVLTLGECANYLHFVQSVGQCDFVFSPSGSA